ncbi:MAG: glutaminase domain-containing protein [Limisphaerales bacterium]
MNTRIHILFAFAIIAVQLQAQPLRPPSVPLVACDPYFSIWSPADKLTDANTVHWTGKPHRLTSLVRIDGKPFRLMGKEPTTVPALPQTSLEVLPTRSIYTFDGEGIRLTLTFMTAALPDDLMVYSRPVTYVTWTAQATDGKEHNVAVYLDARAEIAVNTGQELVTHAETNTNHLAVLKLGSKDQPVLAKKGDDLRIDWGHLYVAVPESDVYFALIAPTASNGRDLFGMPHAIRMLTFGEAAGDTLLATVDFKPFKVGSKPASRWLMLAYDDEYSIQYFKKNLRPYWRRNGDDANALLRKAAADYESLVKRCTKFDTDLMAALTKAGGAKYAQMCALAYRQCYAANKVVADENGQPLMFPKENFSNGCIGTVDVIYPMAPQFLFFSPSLTKAMLVPILDYAASPRWRWPFAPHDLGTYPLANGQVYGGGERTEENQMPVEETGNMLIMLAALAQVEGNADFCAKYWPVLDKWADYLKAKGFDPENQLCTDDFAGHLAHNVNLSAKAICGLGAYGRLCEMRGQKTKARDLMQLAHEFATRWVKEADDGDHFRLAFDKPGTWSQKYNLVWDRILNLHLFPAEALRKEMDFYKTKQNTYGLPLDIRKDYTKTDWTLWTATLTQDRSDFEVLVNPVYKFPNESPSRVPLTDWFDTKTGKKVGFQARSVVGGLYLQMLYDQHTWKKWSKHDKAKSANWAPLPGTGQN